MVISSDIVIAINYQVLTKNVPEKEWIGFSIKEKVGNV